jgi:hypothetical protein
LPYISKVDDNYLNIDGNNAKYDFVFGGNSLQEEVF